jgi:hypothetical protein
MFYTDREWTIVDTKFRGGVFGGCPFTYFIMLTVYEVIKFLSGVEKGISGSHFLTLSNSAAISHPNLSEVSLVGIMYACIMAAIISALLISTPYL